MKRKPAIILTALAAAASLTAALLAGTPAQGAARPSGRFPVILLLGPRQALQAMNHHWTCTGAGRTAAGARRYACTPVQLIR